MKKLYFLIMVAIFSFSNLNAQWVPCGVGINGDVQALAVSGNLIFAGTKTGVFLSTDTGNTWRNAGMTDTSVQCLAIVDNKVFAGTKTSVYISSNYGSSWVWTGLTNNDIYSFTVSGSKIYACAFTNGVYVSSNDGALWKQLGLLNKKVWSVTESGTNIFVGTEDKGVYFTSDNGQNWTIVNNGIMFTDIRCIAASEGNVYAGSWMGGVLKTTDNGNLWTAMSGVQNPFIKNLIAFGSNIFAGTSQGIFLSTEGGSNWNGINTGLSNPSVLSMVIDGGYIYAGTENSLVFKAKLSDFGITDVEDNPLSSNFNFNISPNPANDVIEISDCSRWLKPSVAEVGEIRIYNVLGECVKNLTPALSVAGEGVRIDISSLPSGLYYCTMRVGGNKITKSFAVVK